MGSGYAPEPALDAPLGSTAEMWTKPNAAVVRSAYGFLAEVGRTGRRMYSPRSALGPQQGAGGIQGAMSHTRIILALCAFSAAACAVPVRGAGGTESSVLASTSILADIVRHVAGEAVRVEAILPIGADPHTFQSTPADVIRIGESGLVVINSSTYESFLGSLLENAGDEQRILEVAAELGPDEAGGGSDPHLWLDPLLVVGYVEKIRSALTDQDPTGRSVYEANAAAYVSELRELDTWIASQIAPIPPERRLLVTNHAALTHFANRYGLRVVATVLEGGSSEASVSARHVGRVVDAIRASGAPAIFLEAGENASIARQISEETGAVIVYDLHYESLTPGPPASDYIAMMKHNVTRIVENLR